MLKSLSKKVNPNSPIFAWSGLDEQRLSSLCNSTASSGRCDFSGSSGRWKGFDDRIHNRLRRSIRFETGWTANASEICNWWSFAPRNDVRPAFTAIFGYYDWRGTRKESTDRYVSWFVKDAVFFIMIGNFVQQMSREHRLIGDEKIP